MRNLAGNLKLRLLLPVVDIMDLSRIDQRRLIIFYSDVLLSTTFL